MRRVLGFIAIWIFVWNGSAFGQFNGYSIEIDLGDQMAYLIRNGRAIRATSICSGRYGHLTEPGSFKVTAKERSHFSNMYGKIVDARGRTIVADADSDMRVPRGGKFLAAPMRYFLRFNGAIGMHAGYLPGYAASHGCVRLPEQDAIAIFHAVDVGTPVIVFGKTPRGRANRSNATVSGAQRRRQVFGPRYRQRLFDPIWQR